MELVVNSYTYALLAVAHAEGAAEINLLANVILSDELLKLSYYLARALDVTGATDTYCDFKHLFVSVSFYLFSAAFYTAEFLFLVFTFASVLPKHFHLWNDTTLRTAKHITRPHGRISRRTAAYHSFKERISRFAERNIELRHAFE